MIKVRPKGMAGLYGRLGVLAGQAQRAREEETRAAQLQQIIMRQEHTKEMVMFNAQLRLQTEQRARMWELEKMDMRSRVDFEREERTRQRKLDERQAQTDALEKALRDGVINEEDYNQAYLQMVTGVPMYNVAHRAQREADPMKQYIADLMADEAAPTAPPETGAKVGTEEIRVQTPTGEFGHIEAWEWPMYEKKGFKLAPAAPAKPEIKYEYGRWAPPTKWHEALY